MHTCKTPVSAAYRASWSVKLHVLWTSPGRRPNLVRQPMTQEFPINYNFIIQWFPCSLCSDPKKIDIVISV